MGKRFVDWLDTLPWGLGAVVALLVLVAGLYVVIKPHRRQPVPGVTPPLQRTPKTTEFNASSQAKCKERSDRADSAQPAWLSRNTAREGSAPDIPLRGHGL